MEFTVKGHLKCNSWASGTPGLLLLHKMFLLQDSLRISCSRYSFHRGDGSGCDVHLAFHGKSLRLKFCPLPLLNL